MAEPVDSEPPSRSWPAPASASTTPASGPASRSASTSPATRSSRKPDRGTGRNAMRLGLIGATGHWQTYAPGLEHVRGLTLAAVAPAGPEETTGAVRPCPRHDDGHAPLRRCTTDARDRAARRRPGLRPVRPDPRLDAALPRSGGFRSWRRSRWPWTCPRSKSCSSSRGRRTPRSFRCTACGAFPRWRPCGRPSAAGRSATRCSASARRRTSGEPTGPTSTARRKTFPGIAPWVGIHAFDWLHWILGDVFTSVQGREGTTARPDYPACASQAAFVLTMAERRRGLGDARLPAPGDRPHARRRAAAHRRCPRGDRDGARRSQGDAHHGRPAAAITAAGSAARPLHAVRPLPPRQDPAPALAPRGVPRSPRSR